MKSLLGRRASRGFAVASIWAGLMFVWLAVDPVAAQRPDDSFRRGVQAVDRGEWSLAERHMRAAIQLDDREKERKVSISGMRYESYLPHYFLGLALLRQGKLESARRAWRECRSQGVVFAWRDAALFQQQWKAILAEIGPPPAESSPPSRPAMPSSADRLAVAMRSLEAVFRAIGSPKTPLVEPLLEALDARAEAYRAQRANFQDAAALERAAERLEGAKRRLQAAKAPRSSQRRIEDVRALVESFRATALDELEPVLIDAEIELARNAPDLERLGRIEADLLRRRHPQLDELP